MPAAGQLQKLTIDEKNLQVPNELDAGVKGVINRRHICPEQLVT